MKKFNKTSCDLDRTGGIMLTMSTDRGHFFEEHGAGCTQGQCLGADGTGRTARFDCHFYLHNKASRNVQLGKIGSFCRNEIL